MEVGITVDANVTLGIDSTTYDAQIIAAATKYGIPPTIAKAQIYVEDRSFDLNAFRYEPYTFDYSYVSIGAVRGSRGTALDEDPYFHWNIGIPSHNPPWPPLSSGSLAQGDWLVAPDDIDFRNKYTRVDDDGDGAYSAWELVDHNTTQNWTRPPVNFIAQTTIASSYGLKQISWLAALYPLGWNDANGGRPTELCEPSLNISLTSQYLRYRYDSSASSLDWNERWKEALRYYNRGANTGTYADSVFAHVNSCKPPE